MSYTKLLGLSQELPDEEIIRRMQESNEIRIESTIIRKPAMGLEGVSGYFGERGKN